MGTIGAGSGSGNSGRRNTVSAPPSLSGKACCCFFCGLHDELWVVSEPCTRTSLPRDERPYAGGDFTSSSESLGLVTSAVLDLSDPAFAIFVRPVSGRIELVPARD